MKLDNRENHEVSLFYPLLSFPDRNSKLFQKLETKMRKFEDNREEITAKATAEELD
jgi:hypothetical protein